MHKEKVLPATVTSVHAVGMLPGASGDTTVQVTTLSPLLGGLIYEDTERTPS